MDRARGAVIEIIDRRRGTTDRSAESAADTVIVPNEIRINGIPVLIPRDQPVIVHDVTAEDAVMVTITMFARKLVLAAEPDDQSSS